MIMCPMPRTILIADDDPHIRQLLSFAFAKAGLDTVEADDGEKVLATTAERKIDLVVLDINMPRMDGLETCRRLRAEGDVPILFLSSRDDEIDRVLGIELGADDYVTKPFSPREVVARSMAILRRASPKPPPIEAHARIDALLHSAIEGEANDPPASPADGACWLVGGAPTGGWAGHAGDLACSEAGTWLFVAPRDGMRLLDRSTGQLKLFRSGWIAPAGPALPAGGATVDAEARGAIGELVSALVEAGILAA